MKILLIGEYSNVHWALAEGLRALDHQVTVVSNGDFWKNYPCDIRIGRNPGGKSEAIKYLFKAIAAFRRFRGYDIVQLINPMFLELRACHIAPFYRYLRRHNGKVFLDAFGMDHYYVKACLENRFDYSELMVDGKLRDIPENRAAVRDWLNGEKAPLNRMIAEDCDGIIAGLWEYYISYKEDFPEKTAYIPFPVAIPETPAERYQSEPDSKIRFFLGIQRSRSRFKGTDILLPILQQLVEEHPDRFELTTVENVPFEEYRRRMRSSDILIDQLYSPTPNMNSLLAMSQGLIVAGGGEEVPYRFIGESELRPIINLPCDPAGIRDAFLRLLNETPQSLHQLKSDSIAYVRKHHDPLSVAARYIDFWNVSPSRGLRFRSPKE